MKRLDPPACGNERIWAANLSRFHHPSLLLADELGLFAALEEQAATSEEVASRHGLTERGAEALLGVLTAHGHLVRHAGRYHPSASSRAFLLPQSPYYCGANLEMHRRMPITVDVLRRAVFEAEGTADSSVFDQSMWNSSEGHAAELSAFTDSMHGIMFPAAMGVAMHGDFDGIGALLDIAGGSGCFSIALASRHPDLDLAVFELPAVCRLVEAYAARFGFEERIRAIEGDMFGDDWPRGFDAHLLSNVIHDWDPGACRKILERSFAALPPGGRIYLHESLIGEGGDGPSMAALFSMNMLVYTDGGRQYTASELTEMLISAGFEDVRSRETYSIFSLVSARKP